MNEKAARARVAPDSDTHPPARRFPFALPRARFWVPALLVHLALGAALLTVHGPRPATRALPWVGAARAPQTPEDANDPDAEGAAGADLAVDPELKEAVVSDHCEIGGEGGRGVEDAISDKPFQGQYWNATIGVGGGGGGNFGARFGGRRNARPREGGDAPEWWGEGAGTGGSMNGHDTESYNSISDNAFVETRVDPRSTFSIDVDTASYANIRRFLASGRLPPKGAVRIEEMVNYFQYHDPVPVHDDPFAVRAELARCPWAGGHLVLRIGLKGRVIPREARPPSNLVFLIDVSGSMRPANKLPLLRDAMKILVRQLTEDDTVSIVTYAGCEALVLPSTVADPPEPILAAIDSLGSGGSTHGSAGIVLAYEQARKNFVTGGTNRVILATDGDFNVGVTSRDALVELIQKEAKSGVFLSVLGVGTGNYKDDRLELLADKGNGSYAYIDTLQEAKKVLSDEISGTLVTIAKDVKIQVEFNPLTVGSWRLIGYENRVLAHRDFNDDAKDAGEIGAGHSLTVLYELVPPGPEAVAFGVDALKYQEGLRPSSAAHSGEILTLKLRHKRPDGDASRLQVFSVQNAPLDFDVSSTDLRFACAVAAFGMLLRDSPHKGAASFDTVLDTGAACLAGDTAGIRAEFLELVRKARSLSR